jgi:hypothetical protein
MFNKIMERVQKDGFYQTREEYLEELEWSQELERHLYDELYECVESSSAMIEAALSKISAA